MENIYGLLGAPREGTFWYDLRCRPKECFPSSYSIVLIVRVFFHSTSRRHVSLTHSLRPWIVGLALRALTQCSQRRNHFLRERGKGFFMVFTMSKHCSNSWNCSSSYASTPVCPMIALRPCIQACVPCDRKLVEATRWKLAKRISWRHIHPLTMHTSCQVTTRALPSWFLQKFALSVGLYAA